jgi:transposase
MRLARAVGGGRTIRVRFEEANTMAKEILSEELWRRVEPCIPAAPHRRRVPGPQPIEDRSVLVGILFVLKTGLPWEELPAEMGAGSGMTCLRRLRQWQQSGVWRRIRNALAGAFDPHEIDWKRAEVRTRVGRRRASRAAHRVREVA